MRSAESSFRFPPDPYRITLDVLILDFIDRAPTSVWEGTPNPLIKSIIDRWIRIERTTGDFFFHPSIAKLSTKGRKLLRKINEVTGAPRFSFEERMPARDGKEHRWTPTYKTPRRRIGRQTMVDDGRFFIELLKEWFAKDEMPSFYALAKKQIIRLDLDIPLSKGAHRNKKRFQRFLRSMIHSNYDFYSNVSYFLDYAPVFKITKTEFDKLVGTTGLAMTSEFGVNLYTKKSEYREKYRQLPPITAFDELINAHWRKWQRLLIVEKV